MSWPRDLLRVLYNGVEDELLRNPPTDPAAVNDQDEEEFLDIENENDFLSWEVKLASRSGGIHDFEAQYPTLSSAGREKVADQLSFLDGQLKKKKESPPGSRSDSAKQETGELTYEAARCYAEYATKNGQPDEKLQEALRPSTLSDWRYWVRRFTGLHIFFEQHLQQESTTAASVEIRDRGSCGDQTSSQSEADPSEMLYELLNDRVDCTFSEHLAFLQLPCSDNRSLDMFLSACPAARSQTLYNHWHEASFAFERRVESQGNKQRTHLNICKEVHRYREHRRRLFLSFDKSRIWPRIEPPHPRPRLLETPNLVSLDTLLRRDGLREENPSTRLKKSRLALQLALSLHRLYPGPWIQQPWSATSVQFLDNHSGDVAEDLGRFCIRCKFVRNWKATNSVWQEFYDAQNDIGKEYPVFFLSFAQLLVDISEGGPRAHPVGTNKDWHCALLDKAEEMVRDKFLMWYGEAIRGCLQYTLDYGIERHQTEGTVDPRETAQVVIQKNIVESLHRNLREWRNPLGSQRLSDSGNVSEATEAASVPGTAVPWTSLPPKAAGLALGIAAQRSYFTLFAAGDEKYEEMKQDDYDKNEFMNRMERFKLDFILPASSTSKRIRIAVLDTGLHIDDRDILLRSGDRVNRDLSKTFLGAEDDCEGYDDTHGHGTHVVRLLLWLSLRTEIVVVKVSKGRSLEYTKLQQLVKALEWAGERADADIINLSFGLDEAAKPHIQPIIKRLVNKGKLIFAAASNSGNNGKRAYPAKEAGVFAIHATTENGTSPENMNPPHYKAMDNFATLGCRVPSRWNGKDVFISGTSFAAPVAAAIAANTLEFVQRAPELSENPRYFFTFGGMRHLFTNMASQIGNYDYIRPWKDGMFDIAQNSVEDMQEKLQDMSIMHRYN